MSPVRSVVRSIYSITNNQFSPGAVSAWIFVSLLYLSIHLIAGIKEFPYDAGEYWKMAGRLLDFPHTIRGYVFPALLLPPRLISYLVPNLGNFPFQLFSSIAYAFVLTIAFPAFFITTFGGTIGFARRVLFAMIAIWIFPGVFLYPLTDLPAFGLCLTAALLLVASANSKSMWPLSLAALAGMAAYGAYSTRSIYIFSFPFLIGAIFMVSHRQFEFVRRLKFVLAFVIGAALISIPQMAINLKHEKTASPFLITKVEGSSLFVKQLLWGLTLQRYETSLNPNLPSPALYYIDPVGERMFQDKLIDGPAFQLLDYFRLIVERPADMFGIWGRHLVNGLDVRDGIVYTQELSANKSGVSAVNFLIVFFGVILFSGVLMHREPNSATYGHRLFWIAYFLLPVAAIIPSAVETRFFLPLHLFLYASICFVSKAPDIVGLIRQRGFILAASVLAFGASYLAIVQSTMTTLRFSYPSEYRGTP